MNKIALCVLRERKLVSPCFSYIAHKNHFHPISRAATFTLYKDNKQNQQVPLSFERKMGILSNVKVKLRGFISDSVKVKIGGSLAYEKVADDVDYIEFCQRFDLPDTFQSWFSAIQLHVWMTIAAAVGHNKGKLFKISFVDSMWNDVELRMEKLAEMRSSDRRKYLKELTTEFYAAVISYDEGILSDDTVLAAAVWRMMYARRPVHPQLLENAVLYIRKQLAYLESQNLEKMVFEGSISFLSLNSIFSDNEM